MYEEISKLIGRDLQADCEDAEFKIFNEENPLGSGDRSKIEKITEQIQNYIGGLERLKLRLGMALDCDKLKRDGFSLEQVRAFYEQDRLYLNRVEKQYSDNILKRDYMFGYPANMEDYSYFTDYLRYLEGKMYLMNNCGDPYQSGNYGMDNKDTERDIIRLVASNLGLDGDKVWGYITSGGTESNFWGIREGFRRFPEGKLYFSEDAHYSVEKFASNGKHAKVYPYTVIPSGPDGRIDEKVLTDTIKNDKSKGIKGAILLLTWGTTCRGAIDRTKVITETLAEKNIDYYCHVDAALYGGISSAQKNAPTVSGLNKLKINSVSVSLHKFIGTSRVNGVLIAMDRGSRNVVDYIGQEDSTLLGSRDYPPFSTYQRILEMFRRKPSDYYMKNVEYFKSALKREGVDYELFDKGNIFVINKPAEAICKKYQLATFTGADGREKAHILIFPFHKNCIMDELAADLSESKNKSETPPC